MSEIVQVFQKCVFHKLQRISTWFKTPPSNLFGSSPHHWVELRGLWSRIQTRVRRRLGYQPELKSIFQKNPMPLNKVIKFILIKIPINNTQLEVPFFERAS